MPAGLTRERRRGTLPVMPRTKPKPLVRREERAEVRMEPGGRITIPPKFRKKLGLKPGQDVSLVFDADGLHVFSLDARVRRVQQLAASIIPKGVSLVEGLIADRIEEERRERDE
jgi:bifunctional DNA-binding transcriptional regulator/antitoxin component of YhaV-PrlF toxin-antitoxin module